jgi:signal transduction histidine kinase
MKSLGLRTKILAAFLLVIVAAGVVLVFTLELSAPTFYRSHAEEMARAMGKNSINAAENHELQHDLERGFNQALTQSLLMAALITIPIAVLVSAVISRRIVAPILRISQASARIAAGGYHERLPELSSDELGDLTQNFNRMAEVLEQTEARRIELIGTVAHELRTPLSGLRGYTEGMLDGVFRIEHAAPRIGAEVKRLERLLDDLSDLSRVESNAINLHRETVRLDLIAEEVCTQLEHLFKNKHLTLRLEITPVTILADADRIVQVCHNLLSNALRHTHEGGVTVCVWQDHSHSILSVSDTGEGIEAHDLPQIFERFYRADKSRSRGSDDSVGAGVGLTVAKHLVEAMGGKLSVESQLGVGSSFRVTLENVLSLQSSNTNLI